MTEAKKYGAFYVAGVNHANEGMQITRLEWIRKYVMRGAKFVLEREPDNEFDPDAIKVKHAMKSGRKMTVGYVPNSVKRPLAAEFAPLMDKHDWNPDVHFQNKIIQKVEDPLGIRIVGETYGLMVRYLKR